MSDKPARCPRHSADHLWGPGSGLQCRLPAGHAGQHELDEEDLKPTPADLEMESWLAQSRWAYKGQGRK